MAATTELRTYRSRTMAGALAEVKKDLGPDAVILRTRSIKTGGLLGLGAKPLVEITASIAPSAVQAATAGHRPHRQRTNAPQGSGRATTKSATPSPKTRPSVGAAALQHLNSALNSAGRDPRGATPPVAPTPAKPKPRSVEIGSAAQEPHDPLAETLPLPDLAEQLNDASAKAGAKAGGLATPVEMVPEDAAAHATLETELASIRRLVGQVLRSTRQTARVARPGGNADLALSLGGMPEPLFNLYERMLDEGVPEDVADEIAGAARAELSKDELSDDQIVRQTVLRLLAAEIPVAPRARRMATRDGRPRTIVLVGPTGVGKTTTIAKLAANLKLREGRRVALVTWDTYRIAAVEQLRTYADIIGLPVKVALTPPEAAVACQRLTNHDVILIDSAGRSQRDGTRIEETADFVKALRPHETHLVLPATAGDRVLSRAAERFRIAKPNRLILTKLDEAEGLGVICAASRAAQLPVSYVTLGQEVPDDIEHANAERLARLVLDGEVKC